MLKFIILAAVILAAGAAAWIVADLARIRALAVIPADPPEASRADIDGLLLALEGGRPYEAAADFAAIDGACRFVDERWDTADFRLPTLIRILWLHGGELDAAARARIEGSLLGFKYWIDQPGQDSMCYWSENHQALFATGEYLAGKLFPDATFANDGRTGREHMALGRDRLMAWLSQRFTYGFAEWYSNTYYVEDAAPLATLVDFAGEARGPVPGDPELATKAAIVLDLLLHDIATQSWKGTFVSTMGRAYEAGKKGGGGDSVRRISAAAFGEGGLPAPASPAWWKLDHGMDLNFILSRSYRVPEAIRAIAREGSREVLVRASTGLDLGELRGEGLLGRRTDQMMMLWGMEAFTNPEAISTTLRYAHERSLFRNEFLHDLSMVDIGILRATGLLAPLSRILRPVSDGVAIQRANTYTWRTPRFQLASAQRYQSGGFGDQQHVWSATLSPGLSVFTSHPARSLLARGALSESPGYWVGNGRNPDLAQDRNVVLAIYALEDRYGGRKGFMERELVEFSHAWFPAAAFDESSVEGRLAFGRAGGAYIALVGAAPLEYAPGEGEAGREDLIQRGRMTAWVCELGSPDSDASYEAFKARVRGNPFAFDAVRARLSYGSGGRSLELAWKGAWLVDGAAVSTDYPRFDSPWSKTARKPELIRIGAGGKSLELDFGRARRVEVDAP